MDKRIRELELNAIYEICKVVGQALKLDQALETILSILAESLAMQRATVTLKDEETGHLFIRACHGLTETERKRGIYKENEGVTGRIFSTAQPFVIPDISKEPLFLNKTGSRLILRESIAFLGVPILLHGKPIGVLHVDQLFGKEVSYEEDIRLLSIVATLISQLVSLNHQVKRREEELRKDSAGFSQADRQGRFLMVGRSPSMMAVQEEIEKVAPSKASVLLLGESGTGKTLIARIIHEMSPRSASAFVKINCAALPENLLESELFGYEKGAFTGAAKSKAGRFEEADGGTIFLDEVAELTLPLQAKLLRFLQEREFERLGSTRTRRVDVRIIAATNVYLAEAVSAGAFREDLYYRLNVFPMRVPPLRERKEDIPFLVRHFLAKTSREYGRDLSLTSKALEILVGYEWPGNVREMENLIERLCIMANGDEIDGGTLPGHLKNQSPSAGEPPPAPLSRLEEMEREEILAALERNGWLQSRTARELGLTLRQMGYRVKKFGFASLIEERKKERARPMLKARYG
ncbi:MAG: sigma 54-interacting transcriptional regulator [Acidobacteriota bacterium]